MAQGKAVKSEDKPAKSASKSTLQRAIARTPAVKSMPAGESNRSEETRPSLKRSDLLSAVAARSSLPKSELRAVVELVLDELGVALSAGQDLALPPLGRVKVQRRKEADGAEVLSLRLRRKRTEVPEPDTGDS